MMRKSADQRNRKQGSSAIIAAMIVVLILIMITAGLGLFFIIKGNLFQKDSNIEADIKAITEAKKESGKEAAGQQEEAGQLSNDKVIKIEKEGQNTGSSDKDEVTVSEHRYEVVREDLNWVQAREYCESMGGYLATITSQEENDTIIRLIEEAGLKVVWLGGIDEAHDGSFSWITGEAFSYANWAPGEPNNDQGIEHYLVLYKVDGTWVWNDGPVDANTYYKSDVVGFVCEYD